jgi:hypothetical protein
MSRSMLVLSHPQRIVYRYFLSWGLLLVFPVIMQFQHL